MTAEDHQALLDADPAAFARDLLASLGLPAGPLATADGWSNRVWLTPTHVVRLSSGRFRDSFAHEVAVLGMLPDDVPHARVRAHGRVGRREWQVQDRVAGRPLLEEWPRLDGTRRRAAAAQLGRTLQALHTVREPEGFAPAWFADALAPDGPVADLYHAPPDQAARLIAAASRVDGADRALLDAVGAFIAKRMGAFGDDAEVLVHGDAHFANLLWDGDRLTALLDFEGARLAAPDVELDTLLRFIREPALFGAPGAKSGLTARDFAGFPDWLADTYPALFAHPRLSERLAVYEALWWLLGTQHFPPGSSPYDPWDHLAALLRAGDRWRAW